VTTRVTSDVTPDKTPYITEVTVLLVGRLSRNAVAHKSKLEHVDSGRRDVEEFPAELLCFFTQEQGRVLLVRGDPGAGKTLFTVQALDVLRRYGGDVLYVSTRVDTDTIYHDYLSGTTSLAGSNILDISQDPFDDDIAPAEEIGADRFDPETFLGWLQAVGDVSHPLTVAFDSWDLVERHLLSQARQADSIEAEKLVTRMATLARRHEFRIILIAERAEQTNLDYVVDGGYNRGSVVHFELGPDLSRDAWSLPCLATARNFLSHGLGVAVVPLPESSPGLARHNLEPVLSDTDRRLGESGTGKRFLLEKQYDQRLRELTRQRRATLEETLADRLAEDSRQLTERPLQSDTAASLGVELDSDAVAQVALSAPPTAESALGSTLDELAETPGVNIRFIGPWPPYTFATQITDDANVRPVDSPERGSSTDSTRCRSECGPEATPVQPVRGQ